MGRLIVRVCAITASVAAQDKQKPVSVEITGHILNPEQGEVFASSIRNTIGFEWHPQTHDLWGIDHSIDWLGDSEHGEQVNQLVQRARYDWPYIFGNSQTNPADNPPVGRSQEQWRR
jgi:glucose/arabinose dehydrogenase